jgi:hypothetical protein
MYRRTPDCGTFKKVYCCICGSECGVERSCLGPRGFAQAMSGGKSPYDLFLCPNNEFDWHDRAEELINEAAGQKSRRLREIVREEAEEFLQQHVKGTSVHIDDSRWSVVIDGKVFSPYDTNGEVCDVEWGLNCTNHTCSDYHNCAKNNREVVEEVIRKSYKW